MGLFAAVAIASAFPVFAGPESVEPLPKVSGAARALGIIPCRRLIYEDACREGWAPAPTNDYQKAIWESVKAEQSKDPEKAIKIKYDPKKGK